MVIVTNIDHRETAYQGSSFEKFRRIPILRRLAYPFMADLMRYDRPDSSHSLHYGSQAPDAQRTEFCRKLNGIDMVIYMKSYIYNEFLDRQACNIFKS